MTTTTPTFTDPAPTNADLVPRDQHGRYKIKHPDTGEVCTWTRVTTFADALTTKHALHGWDETNIAWGIAQRPDLVALATLSPDPNDAGLRDVITQAKAVSEEAVARNKGTTIHGWSERVDRDNIGLAEIPIDWVRDDVRAYIDTLEAAGYSVYEDDTGAWIERIVLIPQIDDGKSVAGVAGTFDRIVVGPDGRLYILDLKSGQNVMRFGMSKIPLQLTLYAHAKHWWDPYTDTLHPMPKGIDLERAVMAHVPAGTGHCELYNVDIAHGWRMVEVAQKVRAWQRFSKNGGNLAEQITPMRAGPTLTALPDPKPVDGSPEWHAYRRGHNGCADCGKPSSDPCHDFAQRPMEGRNARELLDARIAWITARCRNIQRSSAQRDPNSPIRQLGNLVKSEHPEWPDPYFPPGPGPQSHAEIDALAHMCDQIEDGSELPFPAPDPGAPKATKATTKRK